ncbi:MAG: Asp-tRNA(Asn) amidotransferase subunit GatC [Candidatus Altiarchaeota archaeon]
MADAEKIRKEGVKLIEEFSKMLADIPETSETHYVMDMANVWRKDAEPVECEGFRDKIKKIAPRMEDGYVVAEKGV